MINLKYYFFNHYFKLIHKQSEFFPKKLHDLKDCPEVLFVLGNEKILNSISVSIVGTRNASTLGNDISFELSQKLSEYNVTIVSGLADGIDTASHNGSLDAGNTIAVIACGFNYIPSKKIHLIQKILENGGAVISEYFPDTPAQKFSFLNRNRIIAALSKATIVVEAPLKSGALNTAHSAISLNRMLFSIPWNLKYFRGEGCNLLIKQKAKILTSYKDILPFLSEYNNICSQIKINLPEDNHAHLNVSTDYKDLYLFIKRNEPISKETIIQTFSLEKVSTINYKLTLMELNNLIRVDRKHVFYKLN